MVQTVFIGFTLLTVGAALAVLLTRNVLYAAFFLLLSLLGVAGLFVLASADFPAVSQIMIYVGGVLVLILFGIMLTHKTNALSTTDSPSIDTPPTYILPHNRSWLGALVVAVGFFSILYSALVQAHFVLFKREPFWGSTVEAIGQQLMTEFVIPFEVIGILLLVALIGATTLAATSRSAQQQTYGND